MPVKIQNRNSLEILLARVRAGENEAVHEVVSRYEPRILKVIQRRLKQPFASLYDCADFLQEIRMDFFTQRVHEQTFRVDEQVVRYLTRKARNRVVETQQRHFDCQKRDLKRRVRLDDPSVSEERDLIERRPALDRVVANRDECDHLYRRTSPNVRPLLNLLANGCGLGEIAAELRWSERKVIRLVERVRKRRGVEARSG